MRTRRTPRRSTRLLLAPVLAGLVALTGCTTGSSAGNSQAEARQSQLNKVIKRGTVRVAVLPDFPPYAVQKPNGEYAGYEIEVAHRLADAMGVKLKMVSTNGTNRLSLLQSDRVDVNISSWTATDERAKNAGFTIPYSAHGASLLFKKSDPIKGYDDLDGKTVSVARGSTNDTIMTENFPRTKVTRFETIADAIAALKSGKVDAAVESYTTVRNEAKKSSNLEALDAPPLDPALVSMGVLQGDQVWMNYLNNFIRNFIASGEDEKLYKKWIGTDLPSIVTQVP